MKPKVAGAMLRAWQTKKTATGRAWVRNNKVGSPPTTIRARAAERAVRPAPANGSLPGAA